MDTSSRWLEPRRFGVVALRAIMIAIAIVIVNVDPNAQSFNSGSDQSDGALTVAANQGVIVFNPLDVARWGRVLDADGDGVYNFTTVTINSGSTLRLQGDRVNKPVYWLAAGEVVINGALDLSGSPGAYTTDLGLRRQVSIPGAGGYAGGAGGSGSVLPTPGEGPGGGSGGTGSCGTGCSAGKGGTFTGNRYLIPLVGGSGGEGALDPNTMYEGGGAGGGAVLIASSTSITLAGSISAAGGNGGAYYIYAGGGSGGSIRLVAPTLSGSGSINVNGGSGGGVGRDGSRGWLRLEGFTISNSFGLPIGVVTRGSPIDPNTLKPAGSIRVIAIDGVAVSPKPSGSFVLPDVSISKNGPVNVDILASGIPPETIVTLQVYPQTPADTVIVNLPSALATLSGTLQSSTATATFTFPYGFSRGFVRATWTQ
jgi:hypothetical protein